MQPRVITSPYSWLCSAFCLFVLLVTNARAVFAGPASPAGAGPITSSSVFLPIVSQGEKPPPQALFNPHASTQLAGGEYTFGGLDIPAGVTVTVLGPVTLRINGPIHIAGAFVGDCVAITLESSGDVTITGSVDNRCSDPDTGDPGPLTIVAGAALNIGTVETAALVESSGDITLTNDRSLQEWEFALPDEYHSAELLPPVCTASANTLWQTALPDDPALIRFTATGVDPDGGPVIFAWDVGDGNPTVTGAQITHLYANPGSYSVTLTATDDDGQSCQATLYLMIDDADDATLLAPPALQIAPADLTAPAGEAIEFIADTLTVHDEPLTYAWSFGDGTSADVITATHSYADPGRYEVVLTVADTEGNSRTATASVYIYAPDEVAAAAVEQQPACPPLTPQGAFLVNQANIQNPPQAGLGRHGRNLTYLYRGHVVINRNVVIRGQDGGDGRNKVAVGSARGQDGGNGGGVRFYVRGRLTVCGGVTLQAGDGGDGGNATATGRPGGSAHARGGNGGRAGREALFVATSGIHFEEPGITIDGGNGGAGGFGLATGGDGEDRCAAAQSGGAATAYGGRGGLASKSAIASGRVTGTGNVTLAGGLGGAGGSATATGGAGGNAVCPTTAHGGAGGRAFARSGQGGDAYLTGAWRRYLIVAGAYTAGNGGLATATGGPGGSGVATPAAACQATTASGGNVGSARALAGNAGRGRINGIDQAATATGGKGGDATATGGDCTDCQKGGDATATAGHGGVANARKGRPGMALSQSQGGHGGDATAQAGKGGDCPECPGGKGGDGGVASATGGDGGAALGNGARNGGNGGLGDARGGIGGKGADCCNPPQAGGNGGKGGDATSRAGAGGNPGGQVGGNQQKAGDGGNGGEGEGPGAGGPGGVGTGIPFDILDGVKGLGGQRCPTTVTVTPTPTLTETAPTPTEPTLSQTPEPEGTPVITGVKVSTSVTKTIPSQPVTLTAKFESAQPHLVDSFFDIFFQISGREIISDFVPAVSDGNGGYQTQWHFTAAGEYWVDVVVVRKADGELLNDLGDRQPLHVEPIPTEIVALSLNAAPQISLPGLADTLLLTARDSFNNVVRNAPPSAFNCTSDIPGVVVSPPHSLPPGSVPGGGGGNLAVPAVNAFLAITTTHSEFATGQVQCVHGPSGATASMPVGFAPWRLQLADAQMGPGSGFRADSFFDIFVDVRLPDSMEVGWQTVTVHLAWPGEAPVQFTGCQPLSPGVEAQCDELPGPPKVLEIRIFASEPQMRTSRSVAVRFQTLAVEGAEVVESSFVLNHFQLESATGPIGYDPALFGPQWRTVPFKIKPLKTVKLHIYRVEGAATTAEIDADVAQAQNAFNLNGLICTCPFFIKFDVVSTTIPITDWQKIDPHGDGLDRTDTNRDGDFDDPQDRNDPKGAQDLGYFDNEANIYYVPSIRDGALGMTYPPDGQAAVHNNADHDGWTLFHELVHVLDLKQDGDFDVLDSPDDPQNTQGASDPLNAMNYGNMGPFLTEKQCNELG